MTGEPPVDRQVIHAEPEGARAIFHRLLDTATKDDLRRRADGTRWTNEQPLFPMLFGYILIHPLLIVRRGSKRLPNLAGRAFAGVLNAATRPFDVVNYLGSVGAVSVLGPRRLPGRVDLDDKGYTSLPY